MTAPDGQPTRRSDGRWVVTVQLGRGTRASRERRHLYGATEAEAIAKRDAFLAALASETPWELHGLRVAYRTGDDGLGEVYDVATGAVVIDRVAPVDWHAADVTDGRMTIQVSGTVELSAPTQPAGGSVFQLSSGKWRAAISIGGRHNRRYVSRTRSTMAEAQRALAALQSDEARRTTLPASTKRDPLVRAPIVSADEVRLAKAKLVAAGQNSGYDSIAREVNASPATVRRRLLES